MHTCVEITKKLSMLLHNVIKQRQNNDGWKFVSPTMEWLTGVCNLKL